MIGALPAEYMPVIPMRQTVVFPGMVFPLRIGRSQSALSLERAKEKNLPLILVAQQNSAVENPGPDDLYKVGTLCQIERVQGSKEEGYNVVVRGMGRFRLTDLVESEGLLQAQGRILEDEVDMDDSTKSALLGSMKSLAKEILEMMPGEVKQFSDLLEELEDLVFLAHLVSANLDLDVPQKQKLLETLSLKSRALRLLELMQERKGNLTVQTQIRDKLSQKFGKQQREQILREQLRAIREELGENGGTKKNTDYRERIEAAMMPEEVKAIALDELRRLEDIGNAAPEAHVIRNYLDLLCALPWSKSASGQIDLEEARKVLEADHYGLPKIKQRILQHLAVLKLLQTKGKPGEGKRGSILLFVGPPGVGKTSLGQSIAKALGRAFVRVSLGGVRDDAEIRGHRRTYIGAMPGRIIQGIKRSGQNNPVLMLDEIDKMGAGHGGDPAAALLEVLDPEQNQNFVDHYLDAPFDLSNVFFIATANTLETIPGPLLDRMEIIELSGYTTQEKFHIAKRHLIPKQLREHGLDETQLTIADPALLKVIHDYTREAGVRILQQRIASLCRAATEKVLLPDAMLPIQIEEKNLEEMLGPERYMHEVVEHSSGPGVVTGLAWTPVGGEILFIESSLMPGSGRLILTGQLGEVMKESAQIALSLVRSRFGLAAGEKNDVHVHVPAGAIPKDGPSAGIAMATALASLFTGKAVDPKLAMTGELTLRGAVMPVGGVKEKVIAAHRAGIKRVILSQQNKKDLGEIPAEVKNEIEFHFAENVNDVFKIALGEVQAGSGRDVA